MTTKRRVSRQSPSVQVQTAAARLADHPDECNEFVRLHTQADSLIARGWDLRRAAWALFREVIDDDDSDMELYA